MKLKKCARNEVKNHFMLETSIQWILVEHGVVHRGMGDAISEFFKKGGF